MVESSSPSYLLLASLDMSADIIDKHGPLIFAAVEREYREVSR